MSQAMDEREPESKGQSGRFLFVDTSSAAQRPRSDQRAINAHIQQSVHRIRKVTQRHKKDEASPSNLSRHDRPRKLRSIEPRPIFPTNSLPHPSPSSLETQGTTPPAKIQVRSHNSRPASAGSSLTRDSQLESSQQDDENGAQLKHAPTLPWLEAVQNWTNHSAIILQNITSDPVDPVFGNLTPGMKSALHHFVDVMLPSAFPTPHQAIMQTQWALEKASREPLVLQSIVAVASAERSARQGLLQSGSEETTYTEADLANRHVPSFVTHKLSAVKIANEQMASMESATKASTIFALMCLMSIEIISGNQSEIFRYVQGLQKLIAWRGGYHAIPSHVTELLLSTSYSLAAMTRSLPPAPPTSSLSSLSATTASEMRQNIDDDLKQMGTGVSTDIVGGIMEWGLLQAFKDLTEVMQFLEYHRDNNLQPAEDELEYINAKTYRLRYSILLAPFEARQPTSDKEEPCRLTILIFGFGLSQIPRSDSALFRTLSAQLKSALQASDLTGAWAPHFELLFWVLMMGAYITEGQRERPWFILNLARVARVLGIREWTAARLVLLRFYYLDRIYAKGMQDSWTEVAMLVETLEMNIR